MASSPVRGHPVILAIDPGARETGAVVVRGSELLEFRILKRAAKVERASIIEVAYFENLTAWTRETIDRLRVQLVAIEEVNAPSPHVGMTNPSAQMATASIVGLVWGLATALSIPCRLIRPEGHGANQIRAYPPELQGAREGRAGTGVLRHCRSAYDIALAANWQLRVGL